MDKNSKIGILGAGIEGLAVAEYLIGHSFTDVTIFDERKSTLKVDLPEKLQKSTLKVVLGDGAFGKIFDCDTVFRSPGIHTNRLEEARNRGIVITSTTRYFFDNCPCKIIGVTGTKGKGTTSALIYEILKADGKDVYLGGNIGESPLNFLDNLKPYSWAVLELSSFQLQDLTVSPHVAVVLMTTTEHLDYHADRDEYLEAKMPLIKYQNDTDFCILNEDYDYFSRFEKLGDGRKFIVSRKNEVENGAYAKDGKVYFVAGAEKKNTLKVENSNQKSTFKVIFNSTPEEICETSKVALLGAHNLENVMPAVSVARILGVSIPTIQKVVYSFSGLEHRLEFVKEVKGVKYYNDSFSTTPETSIAAVNAFDGPVYLIAGGSEKHSDFSEWAEELQKNKNLKTVFLTGEKVADRMEKSLKDAGEGMEFPVKVVRCFDLKEAMELVYEIAIPGDNVVMSPAAASFEQFKNYKVRGKTFRKLVGDLKG